MTNNIPALIQDAIARHQAGDLVAAEKMYRTILSSTPGDAGIVNLLGVALFQSNRLREADEALCRAIELNPGEATFHFNLGNIAKAQGETVRAESCYRTALQFKSYYPEATQNLCNLLEAQKRYADEVPLYCAAVRLNPGDMAAQSKLFNLYTRLGKWAEAEAFYRQVLAAHPASQDARFFYAGALRKDGRLEQAIAQYEAILQANAQHAYAHFHLAQLRAEQGELKEALAHAKAAAELAPGFAGAQFEYADLLLEANAVPESASHVDGDDWAEQMARDILSDRYANASSFDGWLFTTLIDHRFFDGSLVRLPVRRRAASWKTHTESADVEAVAAGDLERIAGIGDVVRRYAILEELASLDVPELTQDSFAGLDDEQCGQAIARLFAEGRNNVLVIGGGPAGLVLAGALKLALGDGVNVLLVENRVSSAHHKLPYDRRWVTNIPLARFQGLVEEAVSDVLIGVAKEGYIGCTVNVLETLLLISCRRLGVKFLFAEQSDYSFLQDSPVQLVFDASGNRFQPVGRPDSAEQIRMRHDIATSWLGSSDAKIAPYGIRIHPCEENRGVTLGEHGKLVFPLHKGAPLKLAMLKLTEVPIRFYPMLLDYIVQHNPDNKYYVWPGTLQEAVNQAIVIINLDKSEYDYLCARHDFPMKVAEALQSETLCKAIDARTVNILRMLVKHADGDECERVNLEAPFLFEPFLVRRSQPERLHGKPLIRIGDSVYNGNMKRGNGLGSHLLHIRHIQGVFRKRAP